MEEALLFDLDDTILFTSEANFLAYNSALSEFKKQISRNEFETLIGRDSRDFLSEKFPALSNRQIDEIRRKKEEQYPSFFSEVFVNNFLIDLIKENNDKIICIVTNAKSKNTNEILNYFKIRQYFNHVITGDLVENGKPDSAIYLKTLEIIGFKASQAIAFEDSLNGIKSAQDAGIKVVKIPKFEKMSTLQ